MLPNVNIILGTGNLGRVASTDDGVVGLVLTGTAVEGKLELNKPYALSSTRDLINLGITAESNKLLDKDIKAFYAQAGEGSELHLIVVSAATTMAQMCGVDSTSPLSKLIESAGGRIKVVGINKVTPAEYEADVTQGIDKDVIEAMQATQNCAESFAGKVYPFRVLLGAVKWNGQTENLFKPADASCNRVAMVLASDDSGSSAAIGQVLGRAAKVEPHQSLGRVKDGQIASSGWFTDGSTMQEKAGLGDLLHDAGYIFYRSFPTRNGCYLNSSPMCAPVTDDYSTIPNGRVIDKASIIAYSTYLSEIQGNVLVDSSGQLDAAVCKSYESMIENAIATAMQGQISNFKAYIDPRQNVLSSGTIEVQCSITPMGVTDTINVNLSLINPALQNG